MREELKADLEGRRLGKQYEGHAQLAAHELGLTVTLVDPDTLNASAGHPIMGRMFRKQRLIQVS